MAGAESLEPITSGREKDEQKGINWKLFARTFRCTGQMNLIVAIIGAVSAIAFGLYALEGTEGGVPEAEQLIPPLFVFVVTQFIYDSLSKYTTGLIGMNQVAVLKRWDTIFGVVGIVSAAIVLFLGGDLFVLTLVTQLIRLLVPLRSYLLFRRIVDISSLRLPCFAFDREVFKWISVPFFNGLAVNFSTLGVIQLSSIVYARSASPEHAAAFLLANRLLQLLQQMSSVPVLSNSPRFSLLLARGAMKELRSGMIPRINMSLLLLCSGGLILGAFTLPVINYLQGNIVFLSPETWLLMIFFTYMRRLIILNEIVGTIGNVVFCSKAEYASAIISFFAIWLGPWKSELVWLISVSYVPPIALALIPSLVGAAGIFGVRLSNYIFRAIAPSLLVQVIGVIVVLVGYHLLK